MKNFLNAETFPFAFPENPLSRKADWITNTKLKIHFNLKVNNAPECAATALLLPTEIPTKLSFTADFEEGANIFLELKGPGKIKYLEVPLQKENSVLLQNGTSEIVFTCWKACNENFKGDVIITFK